MENGRPVRETIDPIQHQTVQMNIEVRGGAKTLDESYGARLGLGMGQAGLFDEKGGDGPVDDLQHR